MTANRSFAKLVKAKDREQKPEQSADEQRREIFRTDDATSEDTESTTCINCGGELINQNGTRLCPKCNSDDLAFQFVLQADEDDEYCLIECPGSTIYEEGTNNVEAGVEFLDEDDPLKGYRIIGRPIYPPTHTRWRRVKKEALGKIRRCQACQDYTIRMRRKEGRDFFIPSSKHPGRTRLKAISHHSRPDDSF